MPGSGVEAGASYGDLLVMSLVVLGAVCIAAFIAVRFFGRFLAGGRVHGAHLLHVVARVPLEPRRSLYVVAVAGKTLLVGTSEMGLSVLSELDAAEVKTRSVPPQSFADLVRGAWRKRKGFSGAGEGSAGTRAEAGAERDGGGAGADAAAQHGSSRSRANGAGARGDAVPQHGSGTRSDSGVEEGLAGTPDAHRRDASGAALGSADHDAPGAALGAADSHVGPAAAGDAREDRGA